MEGLGDKVEELSQQSRTERQIDENKERKVNWRTNTKDHIYIYIYKLQKEESRGGANKEIGKFQTQKHECTD